MKDGKWLIRYGIFIICVAVLAVLYDPVTGKFGLNPRATTALISGGACGGLALLWGALMARGFRWVLPGAIVTTLIFLGAFTWRAVVGWMAFLEGDSTRWYAATMITLMWLASAALLIRLTRQLGARERAAAP